MAGLEPLTRGGKGHKSSGRGVAGRGRSTNGGGSKKSSGNGVLPKPGVGGGGAASVTAPERRRNSPPEARGKGHASEKNQTSTSLLGVATGETSGSRALQTPPGRHKSNLQSTSSHDSNPLDQSSPPSQGTHSNVSRTNTTLSVQYHASSNRLQPAHSAHARPNLSLNVQPQRLELPNEDEEDEEYDINDD